MNQQDTQGLTALSTEQRNPGTMRLDTMTPQEIVSAMNQEDFAAAQAVQAAVGGVLAQISMNMHVHKTRGNVQPLRVNGFAVRGHGIA